MSKGSRKRRAEARRGVATGGVEYSLDYVQRLRRRRVVDQRAWESRNGAVRVGAVCVCEKHPDTCKVHQST